MQRGESFFRPSLPQISPRDYMAVLWQSETNYATCVRGNEFEKRAWIFSDWSEIFNFKGLLSTLYFPTDDMGTLCKVGVAKCRHPPKGRETSLRPQSTKLDRGINLTFSNQPSHVFDWRLSVRFSWWGLLGNWNLVGNFGLTSRGTEKRGESASSSDQLTPICISRLLFLQIEEMHSCPLIAKKGCLFNYFFCVSWYQPKAHFHMRQPNLLTQEQMKNREGRRPMIGKALPSFFKAKCVERYVGH